MTTNIILATFVLTALLTWIAVTDIRFGIIPDRANLAVAMTGLVSTYLTAPSALYEHLMAAIAAFAMLFAIGFGYQNLRGRSGLGGGDVKLFAAAGCWLGIAGLPSVLLFASISGLLGVLAISIILNREFSAASRLPFGPHLALGILLTWLLGPLKFS